MLGHSRCAQTQHEMRITRRWGVVLGNEVEVGQNQVLTAHTAAARHRRAFAIVGHTDADLIKTTACASADRRISAVAVMALIACVVRRLICHKYVSLIDGFCLRFPSLLQSALQKPAWKCLTA